MVRRIALLVLALTVMLAVATAALAGPRDPQLHKRAADVTRAKTLIMKLGDLPAGFVDKGAQKNGSSPAPAGCSVPNLHALVMTADVSSHKFVRTRPGSYAEAASEATFFLRPTQAQKAVAAVTTSKMGRCLKTAVIEDAKKSSNGLLKIASARVVPLTEVVGSMHAKFWDILVNFRAHGLLFHDELVLAYLRRGRVVSNLMLNSLNGVTEEEAKSISERLTLRLMALPNSVIG
jgi:hypothetical protein